MPDAERATPAQRKVTAPWDYARRPENAYQATIGNVFEFSPRSEAASIGVIAENPWQLASEAAINHREKSGQFVAQEEDYMRRLQEWMGSARAEMRDKDEAPRKASLTSTYQYVSDLGRILAQSGLSRDSDEFRAELGIFRRELSRRGVSEICQDRPIDAPGRSEMR